jgi:hypothetical protein
MASLDFTRFMAGLDGRNAWLDFTDILATVFNIGEPGKAAMGFMVNLAGLDDRNDALGFIG